MSPTRQCEKKTILSRCRRMWYGMRYRCRHSPAYRHTEIKVTKNQFLAWAETQVRNFLYFNPQGTPSIDRIDPDGDYDFGNMRVIDFEENRVRSRFICSYLRLNELEDEKDRIKVLAKNIIATCQNAKIDRTNLLWYLRNET